jgi:hypothetical protein
VAEGARVVASHSSDTVAVTVKVPADAKPGDYKGEIQATKWSGGPDAARRARRVAAPQARLLSRG